MKKIWIIIIITVAMMLLLPISAFAEDGNWEVVGIQGFSDDDAWRTSLAVHEGTPYIAYQDAAKSSRATVNKFNGTCWETVGTKGFSIGMADSFSLSIYDDGVNAVPYVAYKDVGYSSKAVVKKFDGFNWLTVGTNDISEGAANYISMYICEGTPYVAFADYSFVNGGKAVVRKLEDNTWVTVGTGTISQGQARGTSLFVHEGIPYLAYQECVSFFFGKTMVKKFENDSWVTVGMGAVSDGQSQYPSLFINDSGTLYLAYKDFVNNNKTAVKTFNGSTWGYLGGAGISTGTSDYTALYIYNGTPYIAYKDRGEGNKAVVKKYNDTSWETLGTGGLSLGNVYQLSFNVSDGIPYIGYCDATVSYEATVMKFVCSNTLPCRIGTVSASDNAETHINTEYTLNLSSIFEDTDGDDLTYKVSIEGGAYVSADECYSYTPDVLCDTVFVFKANDGIADSMDTYTLTLTATNTIPNRIVTVSETVSASTETNTPYTLDLSSIYEDVDGDSLTYEVDIDGSGYVTVDENYSYPADTAGTYELVFITDDATANSIDTYTVILTVNIIPNRIGIVPETYTTTTDVNAEYTLDLSTIFEDYDDDTLTYEVSVDGASYVTCDENFSYTPSKTGETVFVFRALDWVSTSIDIYTVTLTAVNGSHTLTYDANGGVGTENEAQIGTTVFKLSDGTGFTLTDNIIDGWRIDGVDYMKCQTLIKLHMRYGY